MEQLLRATAAYKIFCGDKRAGKLSHAYMLYFADGRNLRAALKLFALEFFGADKEDRNGRLILSEGLPDLKIYPRPDGKLNADAAAAIVEDAALKPLEYDRKLYVISDFQTASPIFQNKLLKVLEEPPAGVHFLLGTTSLAPVLDTVKSRVKLLETPLFTPAQILGALDRNAKNGLNAAVAEACGGVLGAAQDMLGGGWYKEVADAAREICAADSVAKACAAALKYGDFKHKSELLSEMQRLYFGEVKRYAESADYCGKISKGAAIYAVESINGAFADLKFNANFSSLLYDFLLRVAQRK
ncbi:MAG: hypothetical protein NC033_06745 [Clostridiales bacterium]|nr:hypothetical protein [Clostridiales bacterium]